jgi:biopolymer transport protein ExbD
MKTNKKKSLDFEINLLPFISVLAVCISFLLLTAVWVQVGTFSLSQALGTEGAEDQSIKPKATLWVQFEQDGRVQVTVKDVSILKSQLQYASFRDMSSAADIRKLEKFVARVKAEVPELQTALILPAPNSSYEQMIAVMDSLKEKQIRDIGIAPL